MTSFKIYFYDIGLLAAKAMIPVYNILTDYNLGGKARGAITENYLAIHLEGSGHKLYYWESNSTAELDFVFMAENQVMPIECKANTHVKARSMDVFMKKYEISSAIRVSAKNFGYENNNKSVPLYAAWCI